MSYVSFFYNVENSLEKHLSEEGLQDPALLLTDDVTLQASLYLFEMLTAPISFCGLKYSYVKSWCCDRT